MSTLSIPNKQNFKVENIILVTLYSKIDLNGIGELVFIRFNAKLCKFEILNTVQMNPIILAKQYGDCSIIVGQISNVIIPIEKILRRSFFVVKIFLMISAGAAITRPCNAQSMRLECLSFYPQILRPNNSIFD